MVDIHSPESVPPGVLEAFWRYDAALLANDKAVLDELFLPGPETLRGDGRNLLVGHGAISGFRSARAAIPTRAIAALHVRVLAAGDVLIMARTAAGAATGLQTQLWRRTEAGWRVAAAHVSLPAPPPSPAPPAFDTSVWRVVGAPFAPALGAGPLDGCRVAVKDLFAVAGQPVGGGVPAYLAGQPPQPESAASVTALQRAGAQLAGIARTDEFAYSIAGRNAHYGAAPNPAAPGRLGGGSSSGPAAAVALGQAEIGLGTDTAGSIRIPAAYQGIVGFRPTHGAVGTGGVLPLAPSFDTVGWLTRNVATSRDVAGVLLPAAAPHRPVTRAVRLPFAEELADQPTLALFTERIGQLEAAGLLPAADQADGPADVLEQWFAAFRTVQAYEAWQAHGAWISAHPGALGDDVAGRFAIAATVTESAAADALAVVAQARAALSGWLDGAVLLLPTTPGPAPLRTAEAKEIDDVRGRTLRMSCLAPLAGAPAVSLPLTGHIAPVGLSLIGAPGTDSALLDLAAAVSAQALEGSP
ncbi:MAG TPA: AtzH-like domain-containing protein [Trebonia sp.]|nr:AtzH-like domain-containing protein [Trebonia sp.]